MREILKNIPNKGHCIPSSVWGWDRLGWPCQPAPAMQHTRQTDKLLMRERTVDSSRTVSGLDWPSFRDPFSASPASIRFPRALKTDSEQRSDSLCAGSLRALRVRPESLHFEEGHPGSERPRGSCNENIAEPKHFTESYDARRSTGLESPECGSNLSFSKGAEGLCLGFRSRWWKQHAANCDPAAEVLA